jgi:zinc/manganese transport system ATP-binding protein/zinc transport system ATP-binding protein
MELLSAKSISIGYGRALQSNLSFSISQGDILFIRGENGTGKTTLIKSILSETKLMSGVIELKENLSLQYLPQLLKYDLPLSITLREILDLYDIPEKIQSFLGEHILDLRWQDASGGQRQKVLILSRLQMGTDLLILDEPFNHVDRRSISEIMDFFQELIFESVIKGMIVISHVMPEERKEDIFKELYLQ